MTPEEPTRWDIQPQHYWAAIAIARVHQAEQKLLAGEHPCECRCCEWARKQNVEKI